MTVADRNYKPLSGFSKIVILIIPALVITAFAYFFTGIFITLIVCILLSFILNPMVDSLESNGLNRTFSIIIIYLIIAVVLLFAFQVIVPNVSNQANSLSESLKNFELSDKLKDAEKWLEKTIPFMKKGDMAKEVENYFKGSVTKIQDVISGILATVFLIFLIPFVTFFILRDRQRIKKSLIKLVPNKYFEMSVNILNKIEKQLSSYVRAWLLDAFFLGVMTGVGLSILKINNAFAIGLLAGLGHLIPYAGPVIGGIPAILISIIQYGDLSMVLPIMIMFTIIYLIDSSVMQPYIFAKSVDMNPITVIALLLLGNALLGVFGALIAIPIATILKVCARETINGIRNYRLGYY